MSCRLALMVQAAVMDGQFLDPVSPFDDGGIAAEVGIGGRYVAKALVVGVIVIVIDESADLAFQGLRAGNSFPAGRGFSGSGAGARSCPGSGDDRGLHGHVSYRGLRASPQDRRSVRHQNKWDC